MQDDTAPWWDDDARIDNEPPEPAPLTDDEAVAEYLHLVREASIGLDLAEVPMVVATVDQPGTLIRQEGAYQVQVHWDIVSDRNGRLSARPTLVVAE